MNLRSRRDRNPVLRGLGLLHLQGQRLEHKIRLKCMMTPPAVTFSSQTFSSSCECRAQVVKEKIAELERLMVSTFSNNMWVSYVCAVSCLLVFVSAIIFGCLHHKHCILCVCHQGGYRDDSTVMDDTMNDLIQSVA